MKHMRLKYNKCNSSQQRFLKFAKSCVHKRHALKLQIILPFAFLIAIFLKQSTVINILKFKLKFKNN